MQAPLLPLAGEGGVRSMPDEGRWAQNEAFQNLPAQGFARDCKLD